MPLILDLFPRRLPASDDLSGGVGPAGEDSCVMLASIHKRASVAPQTRLLLAPACGNNSPTLNKGKRPSALPGRAAPELFVITASYFLCVSI